MSGKRSPSISSEFEQPVHSPGSSASRCLTDRADPARGDVALDHQLTLKSRRCARLMSGVTEGCPIAIRAHPAKAQKVQEGIPRWFPHRIAARLRRCGCAGRNRGNGIERSDLLDSKSQGRNPTSSSTEGLNWWRFHRCAHQSRISSRAGDAGSRLSWRPRRAVLLELLSQGGDPALFVPHAYAARFRWGGLL